MNTDKCNPLTNLNAPEIQITCISNVYTRMMHFVKTGNIEEGHKHYYDHATLLASGSLKVSVQDPVTKDLLEGVHYKAPAMIFIRKGMVHQLEALENNTVAFCIHALKDEDEQIIDPSMIPVPTSLFDTIKIFYETTQKDLLPPAITKDDESYKRQIIVEQSL